MQSDNFSKIDSYYIKGSTVLHVRYEHTNERTIQTLEDILTTCMIDYGRRWDDHLTCLQSSPKNPNATI